MKDHIKVYHQSDVYFDQLIRSIHQAKHTIDIEIYKFMNDRLGNRIKQALLKAANKNVKVRILMDGNGTANWSHRLLKDMNHQYITTKIYHPFPWRLWQLKKSNIQVNGLKGIYQLFLNINNRNHRKNILIDGKHFFSGSNNFDVRHICKKKGGQSWRDLGITIRNLSQAKPIIDSFEKSWSYNKNKIKNQFDRKQNYLNTSYLVHLSDDRQKRRYLYKRLLKTLKNAKHRIWITCPYFIPDKRLIRMLKYAADQHVDVKIIVPQKSDVPLTTWMAKTLYPELLKKNVKIYEYQPSMIHAKSILIDDECRIGTSNLDHRSLLHDLESDIILTNKKQVGQISQQFHQDIDKSIQISLADARRSLFSSTLLKRLLWTVKYFI
jgi:cardiolipin synthase